MLAIEYHGAVVALGKLGRRGAPLSWAPCRWAALHAIELYLHAFLCDSGLSPATRRATKHDLGLLAGHAANAGLRLRKRTISHLQAATERREYLFSRYHPGVCQASPLNQLAATLQDVATKATQALDRSIDSKT